MKSSGIGGQAVIEGVMMKNGGKYAVAVRKPDGEIEVSVKSCKDASKRNIFFRLPIIRGVVAFIDSLTIGMSTLSFSASFYEDETGESAIEEKLNKATKGHADNVLNGVTVFFSVILAAVIFVFLPTLVSSYISGKFLNGRFDTLVEGGARIVIFILYILLISRLDDIKRMFMYHGAEHKVINCIEHGRTLTVENAKRSSREHKRCGTSFMLNVMLISIIVFSFLNFETMWIKLVARIAFIPVIAGISYEFTRIAGRADNWFVNLLSKPGLLMQMLTTKEPDDKMLEVAIRSVEAVYDWKPLVEEIKKEARKATVSEKEVEAPINPDAFKPLEVDISELFDIKLTPQTGSKKDTKKKKSDSKDKEVKLVVEREEDELLAALDFMFEYSGEKTVSEISDEDGVIVTPTAVEAVDDGFVSGEL